MQVTCNYREKDDVTDVTIILGIGNWVSLRLTGPQTQETIAELLIKLGEQLSGKITLQNNQKTDKDKV
jgi:hypothetical protein